MMIYSERNPSPPLAEFLRKLWYTGAPGAPHQRERILLNGCMQIVISLAADMLTDCGSHSMLIGARGRYEVIDTRDLAELVGIVLRPGGLAPWLRQRADAFFEQSVELGQVWNDRDLWERLKRERTPERTLAALDALLVGSPRGPEVARRPTVKEALRTLPRRNVRQTSQFLGVSERRLHQVFCEDVGLLPKLWSRVQLFSAPCAPQAMS